VVIEVQVSDLSLEIIKRRMQRYTQLGIYVLWILPRQEEIIEGGRYRAKDWMRFLHQLYFGHLYYYETGETVVPVSLNTLARGGGDYHWFSSKEEWVAHGRPQRLKQYKNVHLHKSVNITAFYTRKRRPWKDCPAATLWMHKRSKWE
jgi:competence CoiA-like predicted nuclease